MSKKKNTPISIFGKNKRLTDTIKYTIDGVTYRETIDLDTANGNFGRSLKIEIKDDYIYPGTEYFVPVTNKEVLKKLQNDSNRMNTYGTRLVALNTTQDGAEEAFEESGMKKLAYGDKSWDEIPLPETGGENDTPKTEDNKNDNKIEPKDIFGDYKDIFKKHLKYPIDMFIGRGFGFEDGLSRGVPTIGGSDGSQDYIFIEQFMYLPPQPGLGVTPKFEDNDAGKEERTKYTKGLIGDVLQQGIRRGQNTFGDPMGSCILPIPNRLGVSQGVNWGEGRANAVELGAFQAVSGATRNLVGKDGGGLIKLLTDGTSQARSVFNTVSKQLRENNGGANAGAVINATIAKSVLGRIGINVDVDQFLTRETGAAINPNLELLFAGPQLRTFSFVFNFAPNSTEEAKVVRMIHRWFRQGMLAQKTTDFGNGGSLFLGSPNVFRLCYKNNNRRIKGLNTFKICALTSVQIDFTPDGVYQSYEDEGARSQPVRSTMKVDFNELTPIFANDYNLNDGDEQDPSIEDLGLNVRGTNKFTEDDLGF
tara:strand:- start:1883 stop:3487 length:1605 start_codon:yes stop_codon:yes gene_type:complete